MDKTVNKKLLKIANDWQEEIFLPFFKNDTDNGKCLDKKSRYEKENAYISCPCQLGLSESYIDNIINKPRLMIIGQEPCGFGVWHKNQHDKEFHPKNLQEWAIEYLKKQLDKDYQSKIPDIDYNNSYFWKVFRTLSKDFVLCCNDIDKVYFAKKLENKDEYERQGNLTYAAERKLSRQYICNGESIFKSRIEREIEIAEPDILLFVTGPRYAISMETAFGLNEKSLEGKLNTQNNFIDITESININKLAFWTYHPRYAEKLHIDIAQLLQENFKLKKNKF